MGKYVERERNELYYETLRNVKKNVCKSQLGKCVERERNEL